MILTASCIMLGTPSQGWSLRLYLLTFNSFPLCGSSQSRFSIELEPLLNIAAVEYKKYLLGIYSQHQAFEILFYFFLQFFLFYFIFKLYIIALVLPNIKMNPPQVYLCSQS